MPHNQCPPSRRGHSWSEVPVTDQRTLQLPHESSTVAINSAPDLRLCKRCGALGRVSSQGVIHVVETP
jgi:hypothetical protein